LDFMAVDEFYIELQTMVRTTHLPLILNIELSATSPKTWWVC